MQENIKNLKVNYIDIQNYKNIEGISTELGDWNIIGGYNANGKSSFVESILTGIMGQKYFGTGAVSPSSLVKHGEDKATINMKISGEDVEIILERVFKKGNVKNPAGKTELNVQMNGEKISQATLDELLNTLTLDPLKLSTLSISQQIQEIKNTTGLDTSDIDKKIISQEEQTKESRGYKKQSDAIYEKTVAGGVPKKIEKVDINKLLEIQEDFRKIEQGKQTLENKIEAFKNQKSKVIQLEAQLLGEKEKLEEIKNEGKNFKEKLEESEAKTIEKYGTLEENKKYLENAQETNEHANSYEEFLKIQKSKNENILELKKDEELLKELRSERTKIIAKSNIPKYMEISDELGIIVDGTEYKLLNTARKIEVAIDLVLISGSPLRMIRIEQGGELDVRTLESIKPKILENNFQIFLERPVIDNFDSIIISDGELLDGKEKEDFISKN